MSLKKLLTEEELEKITGGYKFTFYNDEFNEDTPVKTIVDKYPWIVDVYPDLKLAVKYNLTVEAACKLGKTTYAQLQEYLNTFQNTYNEDGTLKSTI